MNFILNFFLVGVLIISPLYSSSQSLLWENTIVQPDNQSLTSIAKADTGYLAFGTGRYISQGMQQTAEIIKVDDSGNLIWKRKLLRPNVNMSWSGDIIKVNGENNYYVSGNYIQGSTFDYLYKITGQGDTIWRNTYQYFGFYYTVRGLIQLKDKSVLMVGGNQYPGTDFDVIARRVDSLGNLMWEKNYPMPGDQEAFDIEEMMDGSLVVAGSDDNGENLILRIGFDGNLIEDTVVSIPNGTIRFQNLNVLYDNTLGLGILSRQGSQNYGYYYHFDSLLNLNGIFNKGQGIYVGPILTTDSLLLFSQFMSTDSFQINSTDLIGNTTQWQINYGSANQLKLILDMKVDGANLICAGYDDTGTNQDYYFMKISGVGEEWIPDRCSYQPPVAGFDFEYNYPVLTLRDTSSGGLKYLDTVYTWQWNTSVGTNGTDDSLLVFFDTAISNTIDLELIISNWYGCRDTVNKTLIFEPNGVSEYRDLEIKIYPNPVSEFLNIEFSETPDKAVLFELYDIQGVKHIQIKSKEHVLRTRISGLPKGLYFYRISTGSQDTPLVKGRGKIVKQ